MSFKTLLCLALLAITSCHLVKEDRSECPCRLSLALEEIPGPVTVDLIWEGGGISCLATSDSIITVLVPKGQIRLLASCGGSLDAHECLSIPEGSDCPPVYLFASWVNTDCETAKMDIRLRKHFCTLSIGLDAPPGSGEPFQTRVRGRTSGLDAEGTPLEGPFSCTFEPGSPVRLPRQKAGDELWLDIVMADRVLRSFALGTYMENAGYDWLSGDLEDISLLMKLSVSEILPQSETWASPTTLRIDI